jgi:protein-S-isoprenylcysteine O-methyltransferase Ste14
VLTYRLAKRAPAIWNVFKTLVVIALFDAIVVWGLPTLILRVQREGVGIDLFFPALVEAGKVMLAAGTLLVLWAGMMLAIAGQGTPLPFDAPRRLVVGGPYAWLRTPMVTGTLGQVVGVSFISGSVIILLLFPLIAFLWTTIFRSTEEDVLQLHFGRDYELYRRSVRCWLPMRAPWRPPADYVPLSVSDMHKAPRRRRRR